MTKDGLKKAEELMEQLNKGKLRFELYTPDIDRENLYTMLDSLETPKTDDGGIYIEDKRYLYEDGSVGEH